MEFTSVHMLEVKPQVMTFSISMLTQLHTTSTAYHNQEMYSYEFQKNYHQEPTMYSNKFDTNHITSVNLWKSFRNNKNGKMSSIYTTRPHLAYSTHLRSRCSQQSPQKKLMWF